MGDGILILGEHEKVTDDIVFFEMHLYSQCVTYIFKFFTEALSIGYHQEDFVVVGVVDSLLSIPSKMALVGTELKVDFGPFPI